MFSTAKFKTNLFNNDSDSDNANSGFGTNKDYAKNYNKFRSKELLKKLKDKNNESDSDSSSESDSSDNDTVNPQFDEAFFKTLASIKKKDPKIYDGSVKFFEEFDSGKTVEVDSSTKSQKALTVKDYERKILLEKGGIYEDEEDPGNVRPQSPTYNEEQDQIKDEFKKVIEDDSSDGEEWGGIFRRREKSKEEEVKDDEQYTKWLAGEEANIGNNAEALKPLKDYWANPRLARDEAFLRDYILNNGYNKKDSDAVPTYEEIVGGNESVDLNLSDDEAELERQAEFEHKFNFRFEEPDSEFIKRYPRTIDNSVRKTDNRRKEKRVEVKERKVKEKQQKMKELEMISAFKKREIEEKLAKLKQVTGNEELPFDDVDLDGDFDPDEYDRKMQTVFNNEYYQIDEGETKPECPDIEDLQVEDWDNYNPKEDDNDYAADGGDGNHCEDDEFNMDCDYDPAEQKKSFQEELIDSTRDRRKRRKRQSKFVEMLKKEKPVFDPNDERTYGEYLEEYYKLDYEDVIGDVPCRFKYTETVPNDFGLTVEEILLAKNKELNQWASLKKATQIRPEHVERNEIGLFRKKAQNEALKRKILQSLYEVPSDDETQATDAAASDNKPELAKSKKKEKIETVTVENRKMEPFVQEESEAEDEKQSMDKDDSKESVKTQDIVIVTPKVKESDKKKKKRKLSVITNTDHSPKKLKLDENIHKESILLIKPKDASKLKKNLQKKHQQKINGQHVLLKANKLGAKVKNKTKHKFSIKLNPTTTSANADKKTGISDERLRAFGINPKKYHKKLKWGNKAASSTDKSQSGKQPTKHQPKNKKKSHSPKIIKNISKSPVAKSVTTTTNTPDKKKSGLSKHAKPDSNKKKLMKFLSKPKK